MARDIQKVWIPAGVESEIVFLTTLHELVSVVGFGPLKPQIANYELIAVAIASERSCVVASQRSASCGSAHEILWN